MADFNAIGNPLIAQGIPRLYGVDRGLISVVGSEIQPVTSPWERDEFWALMGGGLGMGWTNLAPTGAGTRGNVQLLNPAGSGLLCIVERWIILGLTGVQYELAIASNVLGSSTGAWVNRDLRRATTSGGAGSLGCRIRTGALAGISGTVIYTTRQMTADTELIYDFPLVLPPGWSALIRATSDNQSTIAGFMGRERPAPGPELGPL